MSETESGPLKCPQCHKVYPQGSPNCPDDGSALAPAPSSATSSNQDQEVFSTRAIDTGRVSDSGKALDFSPAVTDSSADPFIGKLFAEKYDILSLLGEGGMCKVYKARHRFMKRIVAVKLLHESATKDATAKARFQQEAEAASALSHQNVVTVHDFGFTPAGQAFFVMDCLEGKTLEEILEANSPLPLSQAIEIFTQGCDGLDHAHRKGIVHRDIKPSNLVIIKQEDGSDLVKIVDFGIAKVLTPPPEGEKQRQLTQAGEVFGTPAYMSPEQCSGTPLDGRSDLYSLGCMMYEALSGQPPHLGETFINTIVKHISERPRSFAEIAPQAKVPPHIEAVVMKCLEKDPNDRYGSALELKQALFDAAFASGVKGLRFGAVPEPKVAGTISSAEPWSGKASLSEQRVTRRWRLSFAFTMIISSIALLAAGCWIFLYPGPDGDKGTPLNKMMWQHQLADADDLMHQKKYNDAVKQLEQAKVLAKDHFEDGNGRLETTLNKLGEAYGYAHDYKSQETVNNDLAALATKRVYNEFDSLMDLLKQWEKTSASSSESQELTLQAAAFADRIAVCADKLAIRSKEKQQLLLKKAIKVFDSMENKDWRSCVRFRLSLAECYRSQQQFGDLRTVLSEAVKICPDKPSSPEGWSAKIKAQILHGQLDRNIAMNSAQLDLARSELESALAWVRTNLSSDKSLLKDALRSMAIMDHLYRTKDYDEKAASFEKEAKALESSQDAQAQ